MLRPRVVHGAACCRRDLVSWAAAGPRSRPPHQAGGIQGPDIITNGIALSGTAHWMFDRGLIALSDDLEVLVSRQVNDVDSVWSLVNKTRRATVPGNPAQRPHPSYLGWHREKCFKQ